MLSSRIFETEITNTGANNFSSVPRKRGAPGNPAPTFPVETLRHWYVTPFGGMSVELEPFHWFSIVFSKLSPWTNAIPKR